MVIYFSTMIFMDIIKVGSSSFSKKKKKKRNGKIDYRDERVKTKSKVGRCSKVCEEK